MEDSKVDEVVQPIDMQGSVQPEQKKGTIWSAEVEKEISCENNKINNMIKKELKETAHEYKLNEKGTSKILRSRLKAYVKKQKLISLDALEEKATEHKYLVIIDFEATCNKDNNLEKQEIIEFPGILFDSDKRSNMNEFRSYVKPSVNPKLTEFCQELTGITQKNVDNAPPFLEALSNFEKWLADNGLIVNEPNFTIVTDGSADISSYLLGQCEISGVQIPKWGEKWINIKKTYSNFYQYYRIPITDMLSYAGMQLRGRLHNGIDDARNISRLVHLLLEDGAQLTANECLVLDPTNPRGYVLSNIIRKDNETIVEKKVLSEIIKRVDKETNIQRQPQKVVEVNKKETNKINSRQSHGKPKSRNETSRKENNKMDTKKKIFKQADFVMDSNDFPAL